MSTARENLIQEVMKIPQEPMTVSSTVRLKNIINRYRVQLKPWAQSLPGISAREKLLSVLTNLCSQETAQFNQFKDAVKAFRMQTKPLKRRVSPVEPVVSSTQSRGRSNGDQVSSKISEPIAGGPQRGKKSRGECPKCHSMGVVLSQELTDAHYACIYCGFQVFQKRAQGGDLALSIATELFGRTFDENDH